MRICLRAIENKDWRTYDLDSPMSGFALAMCLDGYFEFATKTRQFFESSRVSFEV